MYKYTDNMQSNFLTFNQPLGLHMNPENRWIKMAAAIPWEVFEKKYSRLFKGKKRCYGLGLIKTKLYDTTLTSIALSVFVTNLFKILSQMLFTLFWLLSLMEYQFADFEVETV